MKKIIFFPILTLAVLLSGICCHAKMVYVGIYGGGVSDVFRVNCVWCGGNDTKEPTTHDYTQYCQVDDNDIINSVGNKCWGVDAIALMLLAKEPGAAAKCFHPDRRDEVIAWILDNYDDGDKIIIAGHSAGGGDVQDIAWKLKNKHNKLPVYATCQIDSVELGWDAKIPSNVKWAYNYYQNQSSRLVRGESRIKAENSKYTQVKNILIKDPVGPSADDSDGANYAPHRNIDNDPRVWQGFANTIISKLYPDTNSVKWGVVNRVCCRSGSSLTFKVSMDGASRSSRTRNCSSSPSWEGYASTTAGSGKAFSYSISGCVSASGKGSINGSLEADKCYYFRLGVKSSRLTLSLYRRTDCSNPVTTASISGEEGDEQDDPLVMSLEIPEQGDIEKP